MSIASSLFSPFLVRAIGVLALSSKVRSIKQDSRAVRRPHGMDVLSQFMGYLSYITSVRHHDENVRDIGMDGNEDYLTTVGRPCWRIVLIGAARDLPHVAAVSVTARIKDM